MIRIESEKGHTEVIISGDSQVILKELLIIVSQVLKVFDQQGVADVVLQGLVDVAEQSAASINDTNFNSKGEKTND